LLPAAGSVIAASMRAIPPSGSDSSFPGGGIDRGNPALRQAISEAIDREQLRLAQLLHDSVCQSLTGVQMLARVIARKLQATAPEAADEVAELDHLLQQAVSEVHEAIHGLRLAEIPPGGLVAALRALARETSARVPCELESPPAIKFSASFTPSHLCQIAEVAISYALRRTGVSRIFVSLQEESGALTLSITDDAHSSALGGKRRVEDLFSWHVLQRRAEAIGARLETESTRAGTRLTCRLSPAR
jgi:signal transduction histidine kinase